MPRVKRGNVRRAKRKKLLAWRRATTPTRASCIAPPKSRSTPRSSTRSSAAAARSAISAACGWSRINAAAREHGLTYGQLINGLKNAGVTLDRKSLVGAGRLEPGGVRKLAAQAKAAVKTPRSQGRRLAASSQRARSSRPALNDRQSDDASSAMHDPADPTPVDCRQHRRVRRELAQARPRAKRRRRATGTWPQGRRRRASMQELGALRPTERASSAAGQRAEAAHRSDARSPTKLRGDRPARPAVERRRRHAARPRAAARPSPSADARCATDRSRSSPAWAS